MGSDWGESYRNLGKAFREGSAAMEGEGDMTPAEREAARKRKKYEDEAAAERARHEGAYAAKPKNIFGDIWGGK